MSQYWLLKSEPKTYSIDGLAGDKTSDWTGVRNYQARNFLRDDVAIGDLAFIYHSSADPTGVVGLARVVKAAEPRIVVRVPDALVDALKPRIDRAAERAGYPGRVILLGDPAMSDAQSRIEWADGGVERDPARVWAEIDAVLQRHVAGASATDSHTLPTENTHGK